MKICLFILVALFAMSIEARRFEEPQTRGEAIKTLKKLMAGRSLGWKDHLKNFAIEAAKEEIRKKVDGPLGDLAIEIINSKAQKNENANRFKSSRSSKKIIRKEKKKPAASQKNSEITKKLIEDIAKKVAREQIMVFMELRKKMKKKKNNKGEKKGKRLKGTLSKILKSEKLKLVKDMAISAGKDAAKGIAKEAGKVVVNGIKKGVNKLTHHH